MIALPHSLPKLVALIILCELLGSIGSVFTIPEVGVWYATLSKPWFTPPNSWFGPIWFLLFGCMGASVYFLLKAKQDDDENVALPLMLFTSQFAFNISWSYVFFGLHSLIGGLVIISCMWALIFVYMISAWPVSKLAAGLFLPYIFWVSIALLLNLFVWYSFFF